MRPPSVMTFEASRIALNTPLTLTAFKAAITNSFPALSRSLPITRMSSLPNLATTSAISFLSSLKSEIACQISNARHLPVI